MTHLEACIVITVVISLALFWVLPSFFDMFIKAKMFGYDRSKKEKVPVPEPVGVITAMAFLVMLTVNIPFEYTVLSQNLISYLGGLLAICWMILLGFVDDVLELKWRHKLWIPTIASLPLLAVYYMNIGRTVVILPLKLGIVDLGYFYYTKV